MPIFEYRCKKCEEEFEALVLGRESAECPSCHGRKLEKLLSTFAAFTGSGGSRMEASSAPGGVRNLWGSARARSLLDELKRVGA